jgi:hypothetical protein
METIFFLLVLFKGTVSPDGFLMTCMVSSRSKYGTGPFF